MDPIAPPAFPREHGAWVMLGLPLLFGLSLAGSAPAAWGVALAGVLAFLAHYALVPVLQRGRSGRPGPADWTRARWTWGAIYLAGAAAAFVGSLALSPARGALLLLAAASGACAAVYLAAAALGSGREVGSEIVGMVGLALAAPLIAAAAGALDRRAWTAAAIPLAYSLSATAYVRAYGGFRHERRAATLRCLGAHAGIVAALVALAGAGYVDPWPLAALVPPLLRTGVGLVRPPVNLRVLGMWELAVAAFLALICIVALAIGGGGG